MRAALIFAIVGLLGANPALAQRRTPQPLIDESKVETPKNNEVCFSPDMPCDVKLTKFMESAERTLDIAIYDITLEQVVHRILIASKRIRVRVIVDRRQAREKNSLVPLLLKSGVQLRYGKQRGIMHDKFTIVDDRMIETGSFNYTFHAATANQENQFYSADSSVVSAYKGRFEWMWEKAVRIKR